MAPPVHRVPVPYLSNAIVALAENTRSPLSSSASIPSGPSSTSPPHNTDSNESAPAPPQPISGQSTIAARPQSSPQVGHNSSSAGPRISSVMATEAFRPQGRLPVNPFDTTASRDSSVRGGSAGGSRSGKEREKPWIVREEDVYGLWRRNEFEDGKVLLIIGEPADADIRPLLHSHLLSHSLVILATECPPTKASLPSPTDPNLHGPSLVILRLQQTTDLEPNAAQIRSILTRAEVIARKWRWNPKTIFANQSVGNERGRSRQRRRDTHSQEAKRQNAVQLSEYYGVVGGEFVVREEIGYRSGSASFHPKSATTPSKSHFPSFAKLPAPDPGRRQFDVLIHFIPAVYFDRSVVDVASGEEMALSSVSLISTLSQNFLTASLSHKSVNQRGRSLSRSSQIPGRASSFDKIRDWFSRSRSRSRSRASSLERPSTLYSSNGSTWSLSGLVGGGRKRRMSESSVALGGGIEHDRHSIHEPVRHEASDPQIGSNLSTSAGNSGSSSRPQHKRCWSYVLDDAGEVVVDELVRSSTASSTLSGEKKQGKDVTNQLRPHTAGSTNPKDIPRAMETRKRAEHGVLNSRSRAKLEQANRRAGSGDNSTHDDGKPAEDKGHLIHVLPLRLSSPSSTLLHGPFAPSRESTVSRTSGLSSAETMMPPLGTHVSRELKESGVSHTVPAARKTESVSSITGTLLSKVPLKHNRGISLDSKPTMKLTRAASSTSLPAASSSTPATEIVESPDGLDNSIPLPDADSTNGQTQAQKNLSVVPSSEQSVNSRPLPVRPPSMLSAAVGAAAKTAAMYSSSRALSPSPSRFDVKLQRKNTAMQVASAAAVAAMEVHLARGRLNEREGTPDHHSGDKADNNKASGVEEHLHPGSKESTAGIPDSLLPNPHRQSTLPDWTHDQARAPLARASDILTPNSTEGSTDRRRTRRPLPPVSLLPQPHAQARSSSSERVPPPPKAAHVNRPLTHVTPSHSTSSSGTSHSKFLPDSYYEKTRLVRAIEQFLLSYSYLPSREPASVSWAPNGSAGPATAPVPSTSSAPSLQIPKRSAQPSSYLLPQGLLDLTFKMVSRRPSPLVVPSISMVELILLGLLDPSAASIKSYRDAAALASKMTSEAVGSSKSNSVTLKGLLALSALNGEVGNGPSLPRAWVGGSADILLKDAIPQTFSEVWNACISKDVADTPPPSDVSVATSNRPAHFRTLSSSIASALMPRPSSSAVLLHSKPLARYPSISRARSLSRDSNRPAPPLAAQNAQSGTIPKLDVVTVEAEDDGWKKFVLETVRNRESIEATESNPPRASADHNATLRSSKSTNALPSLAKTIIASDLPSTSRMMRTGAASDRSQIQIVNSSSWYGSRPPGAALPANPHSPSPHSTFPRYSNLLLKSEVTEMLAAMEAEKQTEVQRLAEENKKLKAELSAMSDKLEAAERRRQERVQEQGSKQASSGDHVESASLNDSDSAVDSTTASTTSENTTSAETEPRHRARTRERSVSVGAGGRLKAPSALFLAESGFGPGEAEKLLSRASSARATTGVDEGQRDSKLWLQRNLKLGPGPGLPSNSSRPYFTAGSALSTRTSLVEESNATAVVTVQEPVRPSTATKTTNESDFKQKFRKLNLGINEMLSSVNLKRPKTAPSTPTTPIPSPISASAASTKKPIPAGSDDNGSSVSERDDEEKSERERKEEESKPEQDLFTSSLAVAADSSLSSLSDSVSETVSIIGSVASGSSVSIIESVYSEASASSGGTVVGSTIYAESIHQDPAEMLPSVEVIEAVPSPPPSPSTLSNLSLSLRDLPRNESPTTPSERTTRQSFRSSGSYYSSSGLTASDLEPRHVSIGETFPAVDSTSVKAPSESSSPSFSRNNRPSKRERQSVPLRASSAASFSSSGLPLRPLSPAAPVGPRAPRPRSVRRAEGTYDSISAPNPDTCLVEPSGDAATTFTANQVLSERSLNSSPRSVVSLVPLRRLEMDELDEHGESSGSSDSDMQARGKPEVGKGTMISVVGVRSDRGDDENATRALGKWKFWTNGRERPVMVDLTKEI